MILTCYAHQMANGNVNWLRTQQHMPWRSLQQMRARWKRLRSKSPSPTKTKVVVDAEKPFPVLHDYVVWQPTTYDDVGGHTWLDPLFEACEE